ncbi:hypothetical protein LBMAG38_13270 [Chloroflexota bacterium]|nr:hypothetical protein LBMAG38_13270 [Chloroflexota bacterium]
MPGERIGLTGSRALMERNTVAMEETMTAEAGGAGVHPAQFEAIDGAGTSAGGGNLDLLLDVNLRITVQLGRQELAIKDVLSLGSGSVIELDKLATDPVDILVNDRLIARGEVVVVDENFGVRVTEIVHPDHRLGKAR